MPCPPPPPRAPPVSQIITSDVGPFFALLSVTSLMRCALACLLLLLEHFHDYTKLKVLETINAV